MKKTFALLMAASMSFASLVPAFAASQNLIQTEILCDDVNIALNVEEEIERAMNGITDIKLPQDNEKDFVKAFIADEYGNKADVPVEIYTTTRKISSLQNVSLEDGNSEIYATTAVAVLASKDKSDTNSKNKYHVTAYATIYWRDNFGTKNEFLSASGGWDPDVDPDTGRKPSLSNATVTLEGKTDARDQDNKTFQYSTTTFEIPSSSFNFKHTSYILRTSIDVNSKDTLKLIVETGLFT